MIETTTSTIPPRGQQRSRLLWLGTAIVVIAGWVIWRYAGPVQVNLAADIIDLPFDVQINPSVVQAQPGELVSVIYRIHNRNLTPLEAFGKIEVDPPSAMDQIQIFLTQCGGLNTFQNSFPEDYLVYFRVKPAGLNGSQQITLRHIFTRAAPPRP